MAGDADPATGYRVVVDDRTQVFGDTSAAAPLWAGLFALVAEANGTPVGQPHAALYALHDVTAGDNRSNGVGYATSKGLDACTGLATKGHDNARAFITTR